jgi:hypothetical protein
LNRLYIFRQDLHTLANTLLSFNGELIVSPAQELEQAWRNRTNLAKLRYDECVRELGRLTAEVLRGQSAVSDEAMRQARVRERDALNEYKLALQIYAAIILHGKLREE